jgi:hypothetical protein
MSIDSDLADAILGKIDNHRCEGEHCKTCLALANGDVAKLNQIFIDCIPDFDEVDEQC